ncbi:hypothetical protein F4802DRAFT_275747 [Xylaria palmicola]|nr:hypothetical protein F4802DRAFT_275747 [Xylaria palmicola]
MLPSHPAPPREPRRQPEALIWSRQLPVALQQWRDMGAPQPRHPSGQPQPQSQRQRQRQRHQQHQQHQHQHQHQHQQQRPALDSGGEPQSADASNSDASCSSSSSSKSSVSSSKARDVTSHLKYLVRGFLKESSPDSGDSGPSGAFHNDEAAEPSSNNESFVPSPKITFLIDKPDDLVCQICQQTPLKMVIGTEHPTPEVTAILPCGHIACHACINFWLASHDSCPFCRTNMIHAGCGHQVRPRLIGHDTIHAIPETLPNGGKIGDQCSKCAEKQRRSVSVERWADLAERFQTARQEAEALGTDEAQAAMDRAKKAFERLPEDDFCVLTRTRYRQW